MLRPSDWKYPRQPAGHCMRCGDPFGGNATAHIVPVNIIVRLLYESFPIYGCELSSVCDACVSPAEAALLDRDAMCPGCGQRMRVGLGFKYGRRPQSRWVCSNRCRQRLLRARKARRRQWQGAVCTGCGLSFNPKRADAKFCSSACRQNAYRLRMQPVS
jgi:hypothetical protein